MKGRHAHARAAGRDWAAVRALNVTGLSGGTSRGRCVGFSPVRAFGRFPLAHRACTTPAPLRRGRGGGMVGLGSGQLPVG